MQRSHVVVLFVVIGILFVCALATYLIVIAPEDAPPSDASVTLQSNEHQVFTDLTGAPISLEQYEGKIRIVNVWASWSPLSVQELQDMQRFAADYTGDDVVFIAINRKEHTALAEQFLNTYDIGGEIVFIIDANDTFYSSVGGYAMPETVVYDKDGNIALHARGVQTYDDLAKIIESLQTVP